MERISVWYVRSALLYCVLGTTAGAWQLATRGGWVSPCPLPLRSLHVEVMLIGWLVQLAVGVALWIFPYSRGVSHDRRAWAAWGLLNGGVLLTTAASSFATSLPLYTMGRALELVAGGLLLWVLWPRLQALPTQ